MYSGSRESSRSGGISCTEGSARFTFGVPLLLEGIDTVVLIIALFALGEAIYMAAKIRPGKPKLIESKGKTGMKPPGWKSS